MFCKQYLQVSINSLILQILTFISWRYFNLSFNHGKSGKTHRKNQVCYLRVRNAGLDEMCMCIFATYRMAVRIFQSARISNLEGSFLFVQLFRLGSNGF